MKGLKFFRARGTSSKVASPPAISKKPRFVLMFGDEGGILVHIEKGVVVKRLFAPTSGTDHTEAFRELLKNSPRTPVYVLTDVADQSYVQHQLPPVSSVSVKNLVKRRLERDFAPDDIKGALALGRDAGGRKDWKYLLISLPQSDLVSGWLKLVLEANNPFGGIYLVPVESQAFIKRLSMTMAEASSSAWQLFVTHHKISGFRQVVLKDGKLLFARQTQSIGEMSAEVVAGNIEQEVLNTIEYIRRLSYTDQAGLDVFILVSKDIKNAIDVGKLKATKVNVLTPYETAVDIKLEQAALPADHFGDVVFATYFGVQRKPVLRLDNKETNKISRLDTARVLLFFITFFAVIGMLAYSLYLLGSTAKAWQENQGVALKLKQAQQQYTALNTEKGKLPMDTDKVISVVSLYNAFSKADQAPFDTIKKLSSFLGPKTHVVKFKWEFTDPYNDDPSQKSSNTQEKNPWPVTINMDVEFLAGASNTEALVSSVNDFIAKLKTNFPDYDVTTSKLPGQASDAESMEIKLDSGQNTVDQMLAAGGAPHVTITMKGPVIIPDKQTPPLAVPGNPPPPSAAN